MPKQALLLGLGPSRVSRQNKYCSCWKRCEAYETSSIRASGAIVPSQTNSEVGWNRVLQGLLPRCTSTTYLVQLPLPPPLERDPARLLLTLDFQRNPLAFTLPCQTKPRVPSILLVLVPNTAAAIEHRGHQLTTTTIITTRAPTLPPLTSN